MNICQYPTNNVLTFLRRLINDLQRIIQNRPDPRRLPSLRHTAQICHFSTSSAIIMPVHMGIRYFRFYRFIFNSFPLSSSTSLISSCRFVLRRALEYPRHLFLNTYRKRCKNICDLLPHVLPSPLTNTAFQTLPP